MVAARTPNHARPPRPAVKVLAGSRAPRASAPRTARPGHWNAKLRPDLEPEVVKDRRRGGRLLLPTPLLVGEMVSTIPRGRVMTMGALRTALAGRFGADATCPLMTGIFATVLAGATMEDLAKRRQPRWPIWRLVRDDGILPPKWPLDARYRATLLREEGVRLTWRNGHWAAIDTQHC